MAENILPKQIAQIGPLYGQSATINPEKNSPTRAKNGVFASNREKHGTKKFRNGLKRAENGAFLTKKIPKIGGTTSPSPFEEFVGPE